MKQASNPILCDGCGRAASPEHIAARVQRLELATRFRPIHIGILFVEIAPPSVPDADFYDVESASQDRDRLLAALGIPAPGRDGMASGVNSETTTARLNEFQHRGYYLTYLCECPLAASEAGGAGNDPLASRHSTLLKRIKFNYRPRHVALLGAGMTPLVEALRDAGLGEMLLMDKGAPLAIPSPGDLPTAARFLEVLSEKARASSSAAML
jgi:hypothetical protein